MNAESNSYRRVFAVLVPLSVLVYAGTVIGVASAYFAELLPVRAIATSVYFSALGLECVFLVGLATGYGWTRAPLAAIAWGALVFQLLVFPPLITHFGIRALLFLPVVAGEVLLLRLLHGERLKVAVLAATESRKARYPEGLGLVLIAALAVLLGPPAAVMLVAHDLRDPAGTDWLATRHGQRILAYVGVSIGVLVIMLLSRSRAPLFGALVSGLVVSLVHLPLAIAELPIGAPQSQAPMAIFGTLLSAVGLLVATRPRFREFWIQLPKHDWLPAAESPHTHAVTHQRKKRHP